MHKITTTISLTQVKYLLAVEEFRHFGRAAEYCNVAQPSLSMQLQKLEEDLGIIIFDRTKRPIMVTEEGKAVVKQAKLAIFEFEKIHTVAQQEKEGDLSGNFHIGVIPTLSSSLIPLFLYTFAKSYPKVNLSVSIKPTEEINKLLITDTLDVGLMATPLQRNELIERPLFYENFYAFLGPNHPLKNKNEVAISQLINYPLWVLEQGHCLRNQTLQLCNNSKNISPLTNTNIEGGGLEILLNLISRTPDINAYTLIPELHINHINEINIKIISRPHPVREVSLVYARPFLKEKLIDALEKTIINSLPEQVVSPKKENYTILDPLWVKNKN